MELEAIRYGIGMTTMEDGFDPIQAAMYFTTAQLVYIIPTGISKLGVGLVLFRLTSGTDMRILLPIYILYKTPLHLKLKIMVMALLGLGALSSIAIIIRLKYLVDLSRLTSASGGLATQDSVEITLEGTVYSILEIGLSILAASLTALRPLLRKIPFFANDTRNSPPKSSGFRSLDTFGNVQHGQGPIYGLEDRNISDTDSQKHILPA
ncbi:hypothetical protein ACHAO9_011747 [Fusarium lateritium]